MKKIALISSLVALILVLSGSLLDSRGQRTNEERKVEKKVEVRIENGQKTATVTTTENGESVTRIYTGEDADEFLAKERSEKSIVMTTDEKEIDSLLKDLYINIDIKVNDQPGQTVKKKVIIISDEKEEIK